MENRIQEDETGGKEDPAAILTAELAKVDKEIQESEDASAKRALVRKQRKQLIERRAAELAEKEAEIEELKSLAELEESLKKKTEELNKMKTVSVNRMPELSPNLRHHSAREPSSRSGGGASGQNPVFSSSRERITELKKEIAEEQKKQMTSSRTRDEEKQYENLLRILKEKRDVDVAFMLDCTGSMGPHIIAAKEQINAVVTHIKDKYDCSVRVAFLGYRDHSEGQKRIETLDFVEDVQVFRNFLSGVAAFGGGDACEDVFGGLEACAALSWSRQNRCLIHIGDAPPHGSRFHDGCNDNDLHLNDADRRGLRIESLIEKMKGLGIIYTFGKINNTTDKMVRVFKELGGPGFVTTVDMADVKLFTLTSVTAIIKTLRSSISPTFRILPKSLPDVPDKTLRNYSIVGDQPDWRTLSPQRVQIARCDVTDQDKLQMKLTYREASVKMAPDPFAEGGQRISFFGIEIGKKSHFFDERSNSEEASVVLKTFKYVYASCIHEGRMDYIDIVETQAISNFLAREFNRDPKRPSEAKAIHFLDVKLVEVTAPDKTRLFYTMEDIYPNYEMEFKKFNSNWGYVNEEEDITSTLNAFSHWTYEHTKHYLMVVDLQGILHDGRYVLTDPAIHCRDSTRFGTTNLSKAGVKLFFESHKCTNICTRMGLKRHRHMRDGASSSAAGSVVSPREATA